uniref:Uncharacterized protein n=1 Tax=Romanomermis culicivorax TaxID=13658 RepID=A0A915IH39_ROMCU
MQISPHDFLPPKYIHIVMQNLYDNVNIDSEGDEKGAFRVVDPTLSRSMLHAIMLEEILALNQIIFYDYKVLNMGYCLYNQQNWVKRDGTLELELIKWANRLPYNEKNHSDNK